MANLTIVLDETVVRNARIRAISEGTSVSAKIREFLAHYANGDSEAVPGQSFLDFARAARVSSQGAAWRREDAYDHAYPSPNSSKTE